MSESLEVTTVQQQVPNLYVTGGNVNVVTGNQINTTIHYNFSTSSGVAGANQIQQGSNSDGTPLPAPDVSLSQIIPRLTTMFTGRKDILEKLARSLDPSKPSADLKIQRIFVLYGLGGAGKTQIMIKFVIDCGDQFGGIYYIDASTLGTIQTSFENIARSTSAGTSVDDALRWLSQQRSEWLLLMDNADDPEINLQQFFPRCTHGNIVITTRNPDCRRHAPDSNVNVGGLDPKEAVELLLKSAMVDHSAGNRNVGDTICRELGYLALAIAQAGAYIAHACSLEDYLQIYRKDRAELMRLQSTQAVDDYKWTVYTTWEMNLVKVSSSAAMLLRLFAFLHHDGIPRAIFEKAAASEDMSDAFGDGICFLANFRTDNGEWSNHKFINSIRELTAYSLISTDTARQTYSIHPLVHAWARERVSLTEREEARVCMLQVLALSIPTTNDLEAITHRRKLLPHLDQARAGGLDLHADIVYMLYFVYRDSGQWIVAGELLEAVHTAMKHMHGDEHQVTMDVLNDLALMYTYQGRWNEAQVLYLHVLEMTHRVLGEEHPYTLTVMGNLALLNREQGKWKEAEVMEVQVLQMRRKVLGEEHPETLVAMDNLAWTYRELIQWKEAEVLGMQVLEMIRKVLGEEHPDTLIAMNNLAVTYSDQGKLQEAEVLQVHVLEMSIGEDHPSTLIAMGNLAQTYHRQGLWKEAKAMQVQVLEMQRRLLGEEHPNTLTTMGNLALTYTMQGQWKEGEALEVQVLEMRRRILGEEHPSTRIAMDNLAWTYRGQGKWKEAEVMGMEVLEITRRVLGHDHPGTLAAMSNLADAYQEQQQWATAKELKEELLGLQIQVLGADHPDTLATNTCLLSIEEATAPQQSKSQKPHTWFQPMKQLSSKVKEKVHHLMQS